LHAGTFGFVQILSGEQNEYGLLSQARSGVYAAAVQGSKSNLTHFLPAQKVSPGSQALFAPQLLTASMQLPFKHVCPAPHTILLHVQSPE
jgi:hypothetical protein